MIANLELYRAFYWTAKEQNLSRAAERLYITQPSVSHAIKQLETELAVTLFYRGAKGVRLSEEGQLLFAQVEQAFQFIESGERQIAEFNNLTRGELRLGSSDSLCKYFLLPSLGRFCNDFPQIRLDLVHGTTPEIIQHVKEGRIDFGIVRMPVEDSSLKVFETITVQDCFVAGPRYFPLAQQELSLTELTAYPLILFSRNSSSRRFIQDFGQAHGVAIEPEIELASVDLLIEFAKAGLGISFVTKQFVQAELEAGKLAEIKLKERIPERKIGIALLKNRRLSAATRTFFEQYLHVETF
ncbi:MULTISPECIES: LysR family transcriptional regulator [unclassified Paenibacillus]|uniref:LysR family transcriptional regulator n=1 Tax=unclassified Paenibacillus TaxID=185978 RepID=UPI001180E3A9|nr:MULTISPECIES: LysR family transcriptional regulator [unclassified Paenibacillus]MBE1442000.1 DNA-binding transcriptional LysR family regulator [Paenibacillus sp. OAS669]